MANRERDERLQMMLSKAELAAVDDFRFKQRMPSRAAALREILRRGLTVSGVVKLDGAQWADFGAQDGRTKAPLKAQSLTFLYGPPTR